MIELFNKETLEFHLPESFKFLTKEYILHCIFNKKLQSKWVPQEGDIIVTMTGNIFTIGTIVKRSSNLGGTLYLFGPNLCNRDGGNFLNETHCFSFNEDGLWYEHDIVENRIVAKEKLSHNSIHDFRFVPYPHELINYIYD